MKGYYTTYPPSLSHVEHDARVESYCGVGWDYILTDVSRRRKTKSEITLISQQITKSKTVG